MLAILQRQGRLIDFLQEDLAPFEDAQIGAAVRSVHAGCKQALDEHIQLEAIYPEAEGSVVSVPSGFDAYAIRLSGNVSGEPPFTGTLRHRGWRASGCGSARAGPCPRSLCCPIPLRRVAGRGP